MGIEIYNFNVSHLVNGNGKNSDNLFSHWS